MKYLLPVAALGLLAACGNPDPHYQHSATHTHAVVADPYAPVVVQDDVYRKDNTPSQDALSDRSLGNSRGSHNQPMSHKDMDNDGEYEDDYYIQRNYYQPTFGRTGYYYRNY